MAGAHIEFLSVDQLKARREKLLHDAGMSYEELLDGQYAILKHGAVSCFRSDSWN